MHIPTVPRPKWFTNARTVGLQTGGRIQTQDGNFILQQDGNFILVQSAN